MRKGIITLIIATLTSAAINAQESLPEAQSSAPIKAQYMKGFPPPPEKRLSAADGSFFKFPALRYSVVHILVYRPTKIAGRMAVAAWYVYRGHKLAHMYYAVAQGGEFEK